MEYLVIFAFGAIIGSFLNVCVYRLPLGRSIVTPPSHCPFCGKRVRWFDNVPILSYIILRGKCRDCARGIPVRYPLVELLSAFSGVGLFMFYREYPLFIFYWVFVLSLITVTFIDIETQEIPDIITLPGILIGLVFYTALDPAGTGAWLGAFKDSFLGILAGGGSMFLLGFLGEKMFRREALGGGDVKLMAMIGAFTGWQLVVLTFFLAPIFGLGAGIFMKVRFGSDIIPYGPYLALASVVSLLRGNEIIRYLFMI